MHVRLYTLIAAICVVIDGSFSTEMFTADVRSVTQCNSGSAPTAMKNFVVDRVEGNNFEMNGTLIIKEDIPGPVNITCIVERCMSEDKPDSCEYYTSYRMRNFCQDMGKPKKLWSEFVDMIKINKECPLKKILPQIMNPRGVYYVHNFKMDLSSLQPLALSRPFRVFWKVTSRLDSPKFPNAFCLLNICSLEPKNMVKRKRKP